MTLDNLASWLLSRARVNGVEPSIEDLDTYARAKTFKSRFTVGLGGVTVTERHNLGQQMKLIPDCEDVRLFLPKQERELKPTGISLEIDHPKLFTEAAHPASAPDSLPTMKTYARCNQISADAFKRLDAARFCIALSLNHPVPEARRVAGVVESVPSSSGRGSFAIPYVPKYQPKELTPRQISAAVGLHAKLTALASSSLRERLLIALHRWHQSMQHSPVGVDTFIDVGIGLETVLVPDKESELTYRLKIRGARLLADANLQSRQKMSRLLGALYGARSKAVHSGRMPDDVPKSVTPHGPEHLAVIGREVLRQTIIAVIDRGRDDWDELELS